MNPVFLDINGVAKGFDGQFTSAKLYAVNTVDIAFDEHVVRFICFACQGESQPHPFFGCAFLLRDHQVAIRVGLCRLLL